MVADEKMSVQRAYFDESGNSGMNYLDDEQPFFVLAAFVVSEPKRAKLVIELRKELERQ